MISTFQILFVIFLILVFFSGFIVLLNNGLRTTMVENTNNDNTNNNVSGCPNLLVRKGNKLSLLNSNAKYSPGKNPLLFNDLEEYKKYVEIQNKNGFFCPVLYLQEENDSQGNDIYKMYSNPFKLENGLQSVQITKTDVKKTNNQEQNEIIFDQDQYQSFNSFSKYHDDFHLNDDDTVKIESSNNAMESNWNGIVKHKYEM